jgi:uncharacterized protein YbjT (DUF2867 family)
MKVVVIGATGGVGRATVAAALAAGHEVTAFSRRGSDLGLGAQGVRAVAGDALEPADVDRALVGQDAVIVTLGISENPLRVRLPGPRHTPLDVRSRGTQNVLQAMRRHGLRRLVVLSSFGVGATRSKLRFADAALFQLLLKPQISDTERQEALVRQSELDWSLVQPVHLTDDADDSLPFTSLVGDVGRYAISRASVARFMTHALAAPELLQQAIAVSGSVTAVPVGPGNA